MTLLPLFLVGLGVAQAQSSVDRPAWGDLVPRERRGGPFGVGMGIGAPTGVTAKVLLGDWMGMQFGAGGDLGRLGDLAVTGDYLFYFRPFDTGTDEYSVPLYLGVGMALSSNSYENAGGIFIGPRITPGASVLVKNLPIELFFEASPTFILYQDVTWTVDGQIGVRYYL